MGDTADRADKDSTQAGYPTTMVAAADTRALFAQPLFNAGIGFFPARGNHDNGVPEEFVRIYPQTQTGAMNATPDDALAVNNPDTAAQPSPIKAGSPFQMGERFSSPGTGNSLAQNDNLVGLSYAFDFQNARLVLIDQFKPKGDAAGVDGAAYNAKSAARLQLPWIDSALSSRPSGVDHAFVFAHKGLITQQHIDTLFGDCPADADFTYTNAGGASVTQQGSPGVNDLIRSMAANDARLYFCGHDHIHHRSLVHSTDDDQGSHITHVLCQSDSSKFYTPNERNNVGQAPVAPLTSNNTFYCGGKRQTQLSQEVYTVGYYVVTVDGANVSVDYYSAPVFPAYESGTENLITTTPPLAFSLRETFGYGKGGKEYVLAQGDSYTVIDETFDGTRVRVRSGKNASLIRELNGTVKYSLCVNSGWTPKIAGAHSNVFSLRGMGYQLGSPQTDVFALELSYDGTGLTEKELVDGNFCLAAAGAGGEWTKAVDQNVGGTRKFVAGPWSAEHGLGTYGVDTASKTVWAVVNRNGDYVAGYVA